MTARDSEERNRLEDKLFEFVLFLLISARGCRDEPCIYGSFRLMDAISRLCDVYAKSDRLEPDPFLAQVKKQVDRDKYKSIQSEEEFIKSMDDLVAKFTDELKVRYSSE
jgi:Family of unknown function (DUF6092)